MRETGLETQDTLLICALLNATIELHLDQLRNELQSVSWLFQLV